MMTKVSSEKISDYEKYQLDLASFIFSPFTWNMHTLMDQIQCQNTVK